MVCILVTGGAGFIGSHTCKALAQAGFTPVAFDNLSTGERNAVKWGPLEVGDVANREMLDAVINKYRPAMVIHFAASAYVGESIADPAKYYRNNVVGTLTLLEAMRDAGIRKLVFSSSCATYGISDALLIGEDTPQKPINPYGASKLMGERMIADFSAAYGLDWVALRYFNAAGADPDNQIGENHDPETHLIPLALDAASGRRPLLQIFGDDYNTKDGTCVRDYVHVSDLASAHVAALRYLLCGGESLAINVGAGRGVSIREIVKAVEQITGLAVPVMVVPRRSGDPASLIADASKAITTLGWSPNYCGIEDIVRTAWAWHQRKR